MRLFWNRWDKLHETAMHYRWGSYKTCGRDDHNSIRSLVITSQVKSQGLHTLIGCWDGQSWRRYNRGPPKGGWMRQPCRSISRRKQATRPRNCSARPIRYGAKSSWYWRAENGKISFKIRGVEYSTSNNLSSYEWTEQIEIQQLSIKSRPILCLTIHTGLSKDAQIDNTAML